MTESSQILDLFPDLEKEGYDWRKDVVINKTRFLEQIDRAAKAEGITRLREIVSSVKSVVSSPYRDTDGLVNIVHNGDTVIFKKGALLDEITQIEESHTIERARYYLNRLSKGVSEVRTGKINDINLNRWKEYSEIITDSLWVLDKRDSSGAHLGWYWGNFVPQIPHQLMLRFTKKGDWVLDPFVGSGTTLIECRRLGRNGLGIELNPEVAKKARGLIGKEGNKHNVVTEVVAGDSRNIDVKGELTKLGGKHVQLILMHPPYYDIIKFSTSRDDLSNAPTVDSFISMFGQVLDNVAPCLEKGRCLGVVIGDKYSKGTWVPLGFFLMNEVLKRDFLLKGIIVKNFEETRGKRNQKELWRYRALVGGFYIFKHEYILLFKKKGNANAIM
jgi:hypothetical protein